MPPVSTSHFTFREESLFNFHTSRAAHSLKMGIKRSSTPGAWPEKLDPDVAKTVIEIATILKRSNCKVLVQKRQTKKQHGYRF
jgi:hypothetical protein